LNIETTGGTAERTSPQGCDRDLVCPSCGRPTSHRLLYRKHGCDILRCAECGLGRSNASGFDPGAYYTDDYFTGGHADGYADYLATEPVLRREFARVVEFIRQQKSTGRLLDLGCAYGFFLQEAKAYYEVVGIEITPAAAAHARASGLHVITGIADAATLAQLGEFDVIVLLDVIEHLPEPEATLSLCAAHLRPGGIIVLTTGDFGSIAAKISGAGWRLMTPPQHLWFFTPQSMHGMARRLGLAVESVDHPWKIVPLSLILFQLRRMLRLKAPPAAATASRLGIPVNLFDAMRVVMRKPG
jgi:SAM-dependent methyltransferase